MSRAIVADGRHFSEEIAPGVFHESFYPGGVNGPNNEVLASFPGGRTWSDLLVLGDQDDAFQMLVPDIRLPANQYWPLHWHDCWTVVLVLEGTCCIGDWWMEPGDVFITVPSLEYGPLVIGPNGCRMFEIFAQAHLAPGGYSPEYRDHPTLQGGNAVFFDRSEVNKRNDGRQILPIDGVDVEGVWKTRLGPGFSWDLGDAGDADRGLLKATHLAAGQTIPSQTFADHHAIIVLEGSVEFESRMLSRDDFLNIRPNASIGEIKAGADGAQLLELTRTARSAAVREAA